MNYEIKTQNDLSGVVITVRVPESEVDFKALNTIISDTPNFIVPFKYRLLDSWIEFIYHPGALSKIQYFYGNKMPDEYVSLWKSVFNPFLECADWFMNEFAFVTNGEYIYWDKNLSLVKYIYIPSIKPSTDFNGIKAMAELFSQKYSTNDSDLEVKVLRALQNFNPYDFLNVVSTHSHRKPSGVAHTQAKTSPQREMVSENIPLQQNRTPAPQAQPQIQPQMQPQIQPQMQPQIQPQGGLNEIQINISGDKKKKEPKEPKIKKGLFGSKKNNQSVIIGGAAQSAQQNVPPMQAREVEIHQVANDNANDGVTVILTPDEQNGAVLRLDISGTKALPPLIKLPDSGMFTIGRFDSKVGRKQSDFEFDKNVHNVSRKHAVIEASQNGYVIIDLVSAAGTWLNGQRIPPNVPQPLSRGCRISFGNAGADYVFEV